MRFGDQTDAREMNDNLVPGEIATSPPGQVQRYHPFLAFSFLPSRSAKAPAGVCPVLFEHRGSEEVEKKLELRAISAVRFRGV